MATAGSIVLDLLLKTGSFGTDLDRTERRMRKFEREVKATGAAIGKAFLAGGAIVGASLALYIKNTIDFQNEQAQLAARLKSTGGVAGQTMDSLDALATEMRRTTAVTGDQISKAQDLLLTFTNVRGAIYEDAIPAILDMSVAMRQDAGQAAILLGKALNDPIKGITALSRSGIQFSNDQKAMIKTLVETGEMAKAQEVILRELEVQFGGSAAAARNTLGGALINLRETFDELLEGRDGGLNGTLDAVNDLSETLADPELKRGVDDLAGGLLTIANGAVQAAGMIGGLIGKYREWLADSGFDTGLDGQSLSQLEARRDAIERALSAPGLLGSARRGIAGSTLEGELERVEKAIQGFPFRGVTGDAKGSWEGKAAPGSSPTGETDAEKAAKELDRAYQSLNSRLHEQITLYGQTGEAARTRYEIEHGALQGLDAAKAAQLIQDAEHIDLLDEIAEHEQIVADIQNEHEEDAKRRLELRAGVLSAIEDEIDLVRMSADAQEIWNNLKWAGVDAESEWGRQIVAATQELQRQREIMDDQIEAMDGLRDASKGFLDDLREGVGVWDSLKDAADRFADVLWEIALNNLVEGLFGKQGDPGGGTWGDAIGSFFGGFFGGGRAGGGDVMPRNAYLVGENGPEMFVPRTAGLVVPSGQTAAMMGGSGFSQVNHFQFAAPTDPRTQTQVAAKTGAAAQRALARNR